VIVLNLTCAFGHHFDGWFASAEAFDSQLSQKLICCPHCDDTGISRLPSGPHIVSARRAELGSNGDATAVDAVLEQLRLIADASEDVGDRFPDEARRLHRNRDLLRSIKGQASTDEMKELLEDGIPILPVPRKKLNH
jgi:hypothetical protein